MKEHEAAQLLARLRSLPPKKRLFLEGRLEEKGIEVERLGILPRLGPRRTFPMSHTQERLFFLYRLDPGDVAYNIWSFHRFPDAFDERALERALAALVKRHEILRTTFSGAGGELVQRVEAPGPVPLPRVDLSHLPAERALGETRRLRNVERRRPFDLENGPLLRLVLLRLHPAEHVLVLTLHHILGDAWSLAIFHRELAALYAGRPLPPLPVQYGDFAHWQRGWQQRVEEPGQLAYWTKRLAGAPEELELPFDRPRPPVQSTAGGNVVLRLPAALAGRLKAFCRAEGATLVMGLLTLYKALLLRLSGQRDLCVGMAVAGRNREELEPLIGFFANTLVLRTDLGGPGLRGALGRVKQGLIEAQDHQDLSFARLVEALKPRRSLAVTPLFQANFAMISTPFFEGTETFSPHDTPRDSALFDLDLELLERGSGEVTGWLYYATALFDESTVLRLRRLWRRLLLAGLEEPHRPLEDLPALEPAERHQLLVEWNSPAPTTPVSTLAERFSTTAERFPHRAAVVLGDRWLSYGELAARSARLAHHLRAAGVGPEAVVGLCLERSEELITALLGVLRAGAAYLPLDPDYPPEHLAFLVEDAGAKGIVTRRSLAPALAEVKAPRVLLEEAAPTLGHWPATEPEVELDPQNAAYVIFTSGSTGRPKGVVVSHHNALRLFDVTAGPFDLGPEDAWTLFHSHAFDFSVWEIFGALLTGGRLEVVPRLVARSPEEFARLVLHRRVTVLNQTPSAFRVLRRALDGAGRGALRLLIFGGEALESTALGPWLEHGPPRPVNMYGITETTVHVTLRPLGSRDAGSRSPIGVPLSDLGTVVADPRGRPVPLGVAGELLVSGAGLARGYLGRPRLTAERFVPHGATARPGARLYRSGDLARRRGDGELEYLGRIDHQVKVRGFRIELGEIEAALLACPGVSEAVVVVREEGADDRRLVAYVVGPEQPTGLREALAEGLPSHMVPAAFVPLAALPLTVNGKVDRAALPAPGGERPDLAAAYAAPETPTEQTLAAIWQQVLRLDEVGRCDNFFELGGDSILSLQVVTRARQAGLELVPRQVFEFPTVAELAREARPLESRIDRGPVTGRLAPTPVQRWWLELPLPRPWHWNQAVLLEVRRALPAAALGPAWAAVVNHHDALRLHLVDGDGEGEVLLEHAAVDTRVPLQVDLCALPRDRRSRALTAAATQVQGSLDLRRGPLARAALLHLGEGQRPRLLLVAHHLVIDGVSWRILLEDLVRAWQGDALVPRSTSFKEWSERLHRHAATGGFHKQLAFWQRIVSAPPLVADGQASAGRESAAETVRVVLDQATTEGLLRRLPAVFRSQINDALLAALARASERLTGQPRLLLDLEGHGREEVFADLDLSRTVGWFTSIFPLLLDLEGCDDPAADLAAVKKQLRAVPDRGVGFGVLRYLSPDPEVRASLAALPAAELSFNYLGDLDRALVADAPLLSAAEDPGPMLDPGGPRRHPLDVVASVADGCLVTQFRHHPRRPSTARVEALAEAFLAALRALVEAAEAPERLPAMTGDIDDDLDDDDLASILSQLEEAQAP
jgi:amino acid adenylation domain-containing protein/non-ribosomal peptide synthase protein (TIGR01720 family)